MKRLCEWRMLYFVWENERDDRASSSWHQDSNHFRNGNGVFCWPEIYEIAMSAQLCCCS